MISFQWRKILILNFIKVTTFASFIFFSPILYAEKAPGGFSGKEVKKLLPLIRKHGVVGLSEVDAKGNPSSMTLVVKIKAPRDKVFKIFEHPENFYYMSTLFKENKILDAHESSKAWSWASRHKWFSFTGTNTVDLYPVKRADVTISKSTLGSGKFTLMFYEDGPQNTILVVSGILNVQTSQWLIKFLIGDNPAMKQAMNIAIGLVIIKGTKAMAEQQATQGGKLTKHKTKGKSGGKMKFLPKKELNSLKPFLKRGQVLICDSNKGGRLKKAITIDMVNASSDKILNIVKNPKNYQKSIGSISNIIIHKTTDEQKNAGVVDFSWTLGFSIFGINSRNILTPKKSGYLLKGIEGNLKGAKWLWQVVPQSDNQSIVAYHGYANIAKASEILRKTARREPYLEHGFVMGSNIVMLRAMETVFNK